VHAICDDLEMLSHPLPLLLDGLGYMVSDTFVHSIREGMVKLV